MGIGSAIAERSSDGSTGYTAQVRLTREGRLVHSESETFDRRAVAEQWLRRVPQDPGGLLRRKFLYQYQRLGVDQDGNRLDAPAAERRPW